MVDTDSPIIRQGIRADFPEDLRKVLAAAAQDASLSEREDPLEYLGFFG